MSLLSTIYVTFLVTLLASTVTSTSTLATDSPSERGTFIDKLNQFVSSVSQSFRSVAFSLKALRDIHKNSLKTQLLERLKSYVTIFKSLEPVCRNGWTRYEANCFMFLRCPNGCSADWAMCRNGWTRYEASCFMFLRCPNGCTPDWARKSCREKQAHLAKVSSATQQQFFIRTLNTSTRIFLGGNDRAREGTWLWPDGSMMKDGYTNWNPGEPNNGKRANCLLLSVPNSAWHDLTCSYPYSAADKVGYVCESPPIYADNLP